METLVIHTENAEKAKVLKAFLKALNIKFNTSKKEKSFYNPEFVDKIKESQKQAKKGKLSIIKTQDLWK